MRKAARGKTCLFGRDAARRELMKHIDSQAVVVTHGGHSWSFPLSVHAFLALVFSRVRDTTVSKMLQLSRELVHRWVNSVFD